MLDTLDAAAVHRWCNGGLAALRAHQQEIDDLNVYPVPDGDTGTNLVLTLASAHQALNSESIRVLTSENVRAQTSENIRAASAETGTMPVTVEARSASRDSPPAHRSELSANSGPHVAGPDPADPDPADVDTTLATHAQGPSGGGPGGAGPSGKLPEENGRTPLGQALRLMARGALLGARGNSGVIVSQILRGMADALASTVIVRGSELARALRVASEAAYAAVAQPVEGTVLSVVAAAAEGAGRAGSDDVVAVARAASAAAAEALLRTPQQLPVLARAGVVDAGGRGFCLLLDALVEALGAASPPRPSPTVAIPQRAPGGTAPAGGSAPAVRVPRSPRESHGDTPRYGYEVQYLLEATPDRMRPLRAALAGFGDSLVVVGTGDGDPPTWNVHVHVDDIGAAIEAAVVAGRPHHIVVTPLWDHRDTSTGRLGTVRSAEALPGVADGVPAATVPPGCDHAGAGGAPAGSPTIDVLARAAVVVAAGDGLTALFTAEGAMVVRRNPSTAEVLEAIRLTGAGRVVLLPNCADTLVVATSAAREAATAGVQVSVVPTRSPVQALAALAVRDPTREFSDDVIAMAEAAGASRYGEVCTASREALTVAGRCRPGDLLGLLDDEVHVVGADLDQVCRQLLDRMLGGGGELVTLVLGADAPPELRDSLCAHVTQHWPFVELQCYPGGQPRYHLLIGVE